MKTKHQYYDKAVEYLKGKERFSTSLLQAHLNIGYNNVGRLIDELETDKVIGEFDGAKGRTVLIK